MVLGAMQSLLDLRVVPDDTSHHQIIQQALQLTAECNSDTRK